MMNEFRNSFKLYRDNPEIVYLDYGASTFMPDQVIDKWVSYNTNVAVSINRGEGKLSARAQKLFDESKEGILNFFDAKGYELVLGKNATECLNLVAYCIGNDLVRGDIVLMSPYEHHSNILPWKEIAKRKGAIVVQLPLLENGDIDYSFIDSLDINRIKVISMSMVSNVNSYRLDENKMTSIRRKCDACVIYDVSQMVGHSKLSCDSINADVYVMSAHKMYGPKGIGGAIIKSDLLNRMPPFLLGGGMVWNALGGKPKWHFGSRKYEAGTVDVASVVAWNEACTFLKEIGMDNIQSMDADIYKYAIAKLNKNNNINCIPNPNLFGNMVSFDIKGVHSHDILEYMTNKGIEMRSGHMCAQGVLAAFGENSINRISWGLGSTKEDIDSFIDILGEYINDKL